MSRVGFHAAGNARRRWLPRAWWILAMATVVPMATPFAPCSLDRAACVAVRASRSSVGCRAVSHPQSTTARTTNRVRIRDGEDATAAATTTVDDHGEKVVRVPWMIVGGGIHGVHIAARLLEKSDSVSPSPSGLCIVDDHRRLLQSWKSRTAATGMEYLRSSAGYHLDIDEQSLRRHSETDPEPKSSGPRKTRPRKKQRRKRPPRERTKPAFTNDYERPRLDFFNQHCDAVVAKYELDRRHVRGRVVAMEPHDDHVRVKVSLVGDDDHENDHITYHAERVVLALGNDKPQYAEWVDERDIAEGLVHHLLDENLEGGSLLAHSRNNEPARNGDSYSIAVVGGGISAAHKVLELVQHAKEADIAGIDSDRIQRTQIHLISRHPLREQQFDTHQDWMMDRRACQRSADAGGSGIPQRQRSFSECSSWKERRRIIAQERIPGTITPAVNRGDGGLYYAIENGEVCWHQGEICEKKYLQGEAAGGRNRFAGLELLLSDGDTIRVDEVLLATGFGKKLPGGKWVKQDLVDGASLAVSDFDGFPIVDEGLRWHPRVFVAGALAELELGPSARNIAGARLAAERILNASSRF